jgi:hypothetical protein
MQLIDGEHYVIGGARVSNNHDRTLGRIGPRFFQYQRTPILCAQYCGKCAGDPRQFLEGHAQSLRFEAELSRQGDKRRRIGLPGRQREAPPQLIDAYVQPQPRRDRSQRSK